MEEHLSEGDVVYGDNKHHRYKVIRALGKGGFGEVYEVELLPQTTTEEMASTTDQDDVASTKTPKRYAMKGELRNGTAQVLKMEFAILNQFNSGGRHFCQVYDIARTDIFINIIIMTLLGQTLVQLKRGCPDNHFTIGTALQIAIQTLESVQDLHDIGYIHRDIKPGNFAVGSIDKAEQRKVYIIDFGLARKYKNNGKVQRQRKRADFRGSVRYTSISSHKGEDLGRKDDLESWLYMTIELTTDGLPWRHCSSREKQTVAQMKLAARNGSTNENMLAGCPRNFDRILTYIDSLDFYSIPDYDYIYKQLKRAAESANVNDNEPYDWEEGGAHHQLTKQPSPPRAGCDEEDDESPDN